MENGTDFIFPNNIVEITTHIKEKYNIKNNHKNLLFVGQIREVKNISFILNTIKLLIEKDDNYHLYLVGEGSDRIKYEEWIEENELIGNIHFIGKIEDKQILAGIYASCDLFFFPSTYDNAPIVVREASIMKTPVLLPLNSVASEPFVDGVNGYLEELNIEKMKNKIIDIFNDEKNMKKVGERAAKEIPISYDNMVQKTIERYKVVIERYNEKNAK